MTDINYSIRLPETAEVLTVQLQDAKVCIWIKLEPSQLEHCTTYRRFVAIRTGTDFTELPNYYYHYLGTVQMGILVQHIFEVRRLNLIL